MKKRNLASLSLTILSLIFLVPGLILPILSINIGAKIPILGELSLHSTKQSILETVESLFQNGNAIVALLILFFSIIIPVLKAILVFISLGTKKNKLKVKIKSILGIIGKWSMADVFIVALFIAFLSTSSEDNINAGIHSGFYYFLTYCILSILAFQLFDIRDTKQLQSRKASIKK